MAQRLVGLLAVARLQQRAAAAAALRCALSTMVDVSMLVGAFSPHSAHIDWCEENYAVSTHVAEFWNSSTGLLLFVPIAPAAWYTTMRRFQVRVDRKARFVLVLMCLAGVGSAWFHAQLSFAGQIFDELSVMWLILYGALMVVGEDGGGLLGRIQRVAFNGAFLCCYVTLSCTLAWLVPTVSHVVCLLHAPFLVSVFVTTYRKHRAAVDTNCQVMFAVGICLIVAASICWVLDRFFCHEITAALLFYPQFHALWHVLAYLSVWCGVTVGTYLRCLADGHRAAVAFNKFGLPVMQLVDV
eukprot:COSAG01_NODE_540_length_15746_cov_291.364299_14_plen_298_part_00